MLLREVHTYSRVGYRLISFWYEQLLPPKEGIFSLFSYLAFDVGLIQSGDSPVRFQKGCRTVSVSDLFVSILEKDPGIPLEDAGQAIATPCTQGLYRAGQSGWPRTCTRGL